MEVLLSPLNPPAYLAWPASLFEWAVVAAGLSLLGWAAARNRGQLLAWKRREWIIFAAVLVGAFLANRFIGVRLPAYGAIPRALLTGETPGPAVLFLSAIPWMLAAVILGPAAALAAGLAASLTRALVETHSLYTVVLVGGLAMLFAVLVWQNYRTPTYRMLRHPLASAAVAAAAWLPLAFTALILQADGALVLRIDYALAHIPAAGLAGAVELIAGGIVLEIFSLFASQLMGNQTALRPSPAEKSLQLRFFYATAPYIVLLLSALMAGDWFLAGRAARLMLEDQLASTARQAASSLPYFLEAGQNLIVDTAAGLDSAAIRADQLPGQLARRMRSLPYFRQLYVFDQNGNPLGGYPQADASQLALTGEEQAGIRLAAGGVAVQTYTGGAVKGENTALVTFLATMTDESGQVTGVLLGRTDLASNPYTRPVIESLAGLGTGNILGVSGEGAYGIIVDENGRILYHPLSSRVMAAYSGRGTLAGGILEETAPDGTRSLVYYQPVAGSAWAVVTSRPARHAQQLALTIAVPLLFMILLITATAVLSLRLALRVVTASLNTLESEAGRIAGGQLDHALQIHGVDEAGRLSQTFEQMRQSLKARLDELNRLLDVSQGVASNMDLSRALQPILEAALSTGASSARVVLYPPVEEAGAGLSLECYGSGSSTEQYGYLDDQILSQVQAHEKLALPNLTRGKGLNLHASVRPRAILAVGLRSEKSLLGAIWLGYDVPRQFDDEDMRFLRTLAGEAAMAAGNTRLYTRAEIGRQRVEAILDSTPDPVFVTDPYNRVILLNPAARLLPGISGTESAGQALESVIHQPGLLEFMRLPVDASQPHEFSFDNGRVYYASVSRLSIGDHPAGKVCILRDITHFKELDTLKSEFVTIVSHDLRKPLSYVKGYATMVQMVGELNDQQKTFVRKITDGVDGMTEKINNLLDLGRIETGMGLQLESIPVNELMDRVVTSLQVQAAQKKIALDRAYIDDDNPIICVDQDLLTQALTNLVENAIKFTKGGGRVSLKVAMNRDAVTFSVADTGIGIAPLDQPHLFEKYYKGVQREGYGQQGSGLGLAIVRSIAERHGGQVWVESSLGKGSTFFLKIPYQQPES